MSDLAQVLQDAVDDIRTLAEEREGGFPYFSWGELRERLIAISGRLEKEIAPLTQQPDLAHLREVQDDEDFRVRSQFE